jgi:hypothetical protein
VRTRLAITAAAVALAAVGVVAFPTAAIDEARSDAPYAPNAQCVSALPESPHAMIPSPVPTSDPVLEQMDQAAAAGELDLSWLGDFADVSDAIQKDFPDEFAESRVNADQTSGTIRFARAVPEAAQALAATVPRIALEGNQGYTSAGMQEATRRVMDAAAGAIARADSMASYFDGADRSLHFEYSLRGADSDPLVVPTQRDVDRLCGELLTAVALPPGIALAVSYVEYSFAVEVTPEAD